MILIRRLYVYLILGVSLFVFAFGLTNLLELAISQAWTAIGDSRSVSRTSEEVREAMSLSLALLAVSIPVWLTHWYLAERWSHTDRPDSDRASGVRSLFFAAVLLITAINILTQLVPVLEAGLATLLGGTAWMTAGDVIFSVSLLSVLLMIWVFHFVVRMRDERSVEMTGSGIWPVRFSLYAAAFIGAAMMLTGTVNLLRLAIDAAAGVAQFTPGSDWWATNVASGVSLVLVGGLVWGFHWFRSLQLLERKDWRGAHEQRSALRRAYLYLVVLGSVIATLAGLSLGVTEVLKASFGVTTVVADPWWSRIASPLVIAIPFGLFWAIHQRIISLEAERFESGPRKLAVDRMYGYVVSLIALAFTAGGLAYLLGVFIEYAFERARILETDPQWIPERISLVLSFILIGGSVWVWHWYRIQRRVEANPELERTATSRRVYVYVIMTATTLATLIALSIILYQGLQILLGVRSTEGVASEVGDLIGIVLVAGMLLAYHISILVGDLRHEEPAVVTADEGGAIPIPRASMTLTLTGPETGDFRATVAEIRRHLPDGFELLGAEPEPAIERAGREPAPFEETSEDDHEDGLDEPDAGEAEGRIFT